MGQMFHNDYLLKCGNSSGHFCLKHDRFVMNRDERSKRFFLITRAAFTEMKFEIRNETGEMTERFG